MDKYLPTKMHIHIDSREQKEVQFPANFKYYHEAQCRVARVSWEMVTLPTADYTVKGHETTVLVETKRGAREVYTNMKTGDRNRFLRVLDRMADECMYPFVVLEISPSDLTTDERGYQNLPDIRACDKMDAIQRLELEVLRRRIGLVWAPPPSEKHPRRVGEMVLRLMLGAIQASVRTRKWTRSKLSTVIS